VEAHLPRRALALLDPMMAIDPPPAKPGLQLTAIDYRVMNEREDDQKEDTH
jgi:hypothetical protein